MYIILCFILFMFSSCASRPVVNARHERIETQMQPIPIAADTIEIEYRLQSTDYRVQITDALHPKLSS